MQRKKQPSKPQEAADDTDLAAGQVLLASTQPIVVVKPLLAPVALAARMLGLGRTSVWGLIRDGELRTVRVGTRRLLLVSEIEAWVSRLAEDGEV